MTMPLLTPETVKKTAAQGEQEARLRIRDMALEEERLVKSINDLRKDEEDAKKHFIEVVAKARNDAQVEMNQIELQLMPLRAERIELMKPIEQLRSETEARDKASQEREQAVGSRETAADQREKDLDEREATFLATSADRKQEQDERQKDLDDREERVKQEEERSKASLEGLNGRWATFHQTVNAKEEELIKREAAVEAGDKANKTRAEQLDKRELEQKEHDRQIADRYATLASAEQEKAGTGKDFITLE